MIVWGIILFVTSTIAYMGQAISVFWPETAATLGLTEAEATVDPVFHADGRGEAYWDVAVLWTLPLAALLLILNNPAWVYLGLVGGGMYLYFAGRGIMSRQVMHGRGVRIGSPTTLRVAYLFLALWGCAAGVTIILALASLLQA